MARRTFFSFYYGEDVWRASNVRNSWVGKDREDAGFFDNSLWESTKRKGGDSLKTLIREGMSNTSVTCILNGAHTYSRPWVRYEIVRSVLKGNGLLTVDIHQVKDSQGKVTGRGPDSLDYIGLYKASQSGNIYFAEINARNEWVTYQGYTQSVPASDLWFPAPTSSTPVPISRHYLRYDFVGQNGRENMGGWIETAAGLTGR